MNSIQTAAIDAVVELVARNGIAETVSSTAALEALTTARADLATAESNLQELRNDTETATEEIIPLRTAAETAVLILRERAEAALLARGQSRIDDLRAARHAAGVAKQNALTAYSVAEATDLSNFGPLFDSTAEATLALDAMQRSQHYSSVFKVAYNTLLDANGLDARMSSALNGAELRELIITAGLN